jgi:hypothetical protein
MTQMDLIYLRLVKNKMELLSELKNNVFFILGYRKYGSTILRFNYNEKEDTFSIPERFDQEGEAEKYEIINDSVKFDKWTISKSGKKYNILVHENQTLYKLIPDFPIQMVI